MADETDTTADDVEAAAIEQMADGVTQVSTDGVASTLTDPKKTLEALDHLDRRAGRKAAERLPAAGLRFTKLRPPGGV